MITSLLPEHIERARQIHEKFYKDEFDMPDFLRNFICAFTVTCDEDIIAVAGVRPIAEVVLITNKDFSPRDRRYALYQVLDATSFIARENHFDSIHAFVQDKSWYEQLMRTGFKPTKGLPLVIGV